MFDHNSILASHVHECHHHMDFENVEVVGHEAHYHQRLFVEAWMSVKDPNAGNDQIAIPEVYKRLRWLNTVFDTCVSFTFFSKTLDLSVAKNGSKQVNNTNFHFFYG